MGCSSIACNPPAFLLGYPESLPVPRLPGLTDRWICNPTLYIMRYKLLLLLVLFSIYIYCMYIVAVIFMEEKINIRWLICLFSVRFLIPDNQDDFFTGAQRSRIVSSIFVIFHCIQCRPELINLHFVLKPQYITLNITVTSQLKIQIVVYYLICSNENKMQEIIKSLCLQTSNAILHVCAWFF